jgi:hypothetical protein
MAKVIVDTTGHGMPELLVVDLKRHFSSQQALDSVASILVDSFKRRRVQKENWENIVLPLVAKNNLKLPFYRDEDTGLLYQNSINDESVDEYAVEGACNASS